MGKKILAFSIHFDTPQAVFYAGRTISGYVLLDLKMPMEMRGIYLKLSGKSYVYWKSRKKRYTEKEVIVNDTAILLDGVKEAGTTQYSHPAGKKRYPFCFQLSPKLPSSFEGRHGHIRYALKAKIEKPWKLDRKIDCRVEVHERTDTNEIKYIGKQNVEAEKHFSSLCCLNGIVKLSSDIERTCYCPGEEIPFNVKVVNNSYQSMGKIRAKLVQSVTYTAPGGSKTVNKDVVVVVGPSIRRNTSARWEKQVIGLPASLSLPPSISNCKLIAVHYNLLILVGKSEIVGNEYGIVIGTLPFVPGMVNERERNDGTGTIKRRAPQPPPLQMPSPQSQSLPQSPQHSSVNSPVQSPPQSLPQSPAPYLPAVQPAVVQPQPQPQSPQLSQSTQWTQTPQTPQSPSPQPCPVVTYIPQPPHAPLQPQAPQLPSSPGKTSSSYPSFPEPCAFTDPPPYSPGPPDYTGPSCSSYTGASGENYPGSL